jgi:hypothetical protein
LGHFLGCGGTAQRKVEELHALARLYPDLLKSQGTRESPFAPRLLEFLGEIFEDGTGFCPGRAPFRADKIGE